MPPTGARKLVRRLPTKRVEAAKPCSVPLAEEYLLGHPLWITLQPRLQLYGVKE
jgi:hypothetical protein